MTGKKKTTLKEQVETGLSFVDDVIQLMDNAVEKNNQARNFLVKLKKRVDENGIDITLTSHGFQIKAKATGSFKCLSLPDREKKSVLLNVEKGSPIPEIIPDDVIKGIFEKILPLGEGSVALSHNQLGITISK